MNSAQSCQGRCEGFDPTYVSVRVSVLCVNSQSHRLDGLQIDFIELLNMPFRLLDSLDVEEVKVIDHQYDRQRDEKNWESCFLIIEGYQASSSTGSDEVQQVKV